MFWLRPLEEFKVPLTVDAGSAENVLDDKNRKRIVTGDNHGTQNTRLRICQVVAALAGKRETIKRKHPHELPVVDGRDAAHASGV